MELLMKVSQTKSLSTAPDVVDVLDASHRETLERLTQLEQLVTDLPSSTTATDPMSQSHALLAYFTGPLREHNFDEEKHVFPALLQGSDPEILRAAQVLLEDHAWIELHWLDLEPQLKALAGGLPVPDSDSLKACTAAFSALLKDHIAVEEALIYPQFRNKLTAALRRSMSREISKRHAKAAPSALITRQHPEEGR
jgi:iron-sulfur cluster repair protein YtfE (RIC family)